MKRQLKRIKQGSPPVGVVRGLPQNMIEKGMIPDVPADHEQASSIYKLYRAGVMTGSNAEGNFYPDKTIRKAIAKQCTTTDHAYQNMMGMLLPRSFRVLTACFTAEERETAPAQRQKTYRQRAIFWTIRPKNRPFRRQPAGKRRTGAFRKTRTKRIPL